MAGLLRILLIEDSDDDAQLILRELRRGGYEVEYEMVETRASMETALQKGAWDLILSDYSMPLFSAIEALETLRAAQLDLPFLILSGTINEETAVATLKAGAHDFILKGKLARLIPAIEREMRDAEVRRAHREAEAEREILIEKLEATNAELERFMYTAFHDLRSPLVTIKGFLGMLKKDLQAQRQDRLEQDFERITGAADKLDRLLSDLLALARLERIKNPLEEVDLHRLTEEALETVDEQIHSRNMTVEISSDLPVVYGDRSRLREALVNLVDNAVKYSGDQPNPSITIGTRQDGGERIIFVRDNGIGIDPRYHSRIFNLFEKLDPTNEGTGLGLALTKRIVERHGGRIWVESLGPGKGATFCFTLPDSREAKV
jgi:signal transduction histidine kinase